MSRWTHKAEPVKPHDADPHYLSTGKWVCDACREPILLDGRAVPITADRAAPVPEVEPSMGAQP